MTSSDIDIEILKSLSTNSRESLRKIAKRIGVPTSTVHERVKRLLKNKLIKRFTTEIDPNIVGLEITALIMMSVDGQHILEVEDSVSRHPCVIAAYDITGDFDVAVIAKFRNMRELNDFIKNLLKNPYVKRTVTNVVLNVVKEEYCPNNIIGILPPKAKE
jgi:DNA-binding Lrp family transcriptional regulator